MHADTLYHRMLAQERAIEEAKAAGQPIPHFRSILSPDQTPLPAAGTSVQSEGKLADDVPQLSAATVRSLTPEAAAALKERMKPLDAVEREAEERSTMAEIEAAAEASRKIDQLNEERRQRTRIGRGETEEEERRGGWFEWLVKGPGK